MRRRLLALGLLALALGAITATGAITGGDEAAPEVYLNPAPTNEGDRYASIDGNGQLRVNISGINDDAVTDFREVFNVSATDEVRVWVEHSADGVTLYRSDTGESIEGSDRAIEFAGGETVPVGIRADSRSGNVSLSDVRFHAATPEPTDTPTETDTPTPETDTPTDDGSDFTPTETPSTAPTPVRIVVTPDPETPTEPTATDTPTPGGAIEVAGFPLWQLALLGLALLSLVGALAVWRLRGEPSVTVRLAADSPLSIEPGAGDDLETTVLAEGEAVRVRGEPIATAATTEEMGTVSRVFTLANQGDGPVSVSARLAAGSVEGLALLADGPAQADLLVGESTLGPGDTMAVSLVFPENATSPDLDIIVETSSG